MAANLVLPFTHTAGKPQDASEFMANLRAIQAWIVSNAQLLDGTVAMGGTLTGPASDPTTTAQYMRKSYADALTTSLAASRVAADLATPRHGCGVRRAAVQTFTTTPTAVSFTSEDWDTDNYFTPTSTVVTIPSGLGGLYAIGTFCAVTNATNHWDATIAINGSLMIGPYYGVNITTTPNYPNTDGQGSNFVTTNLNVGDTVSLVGNSRIATIDATARLIVHRLGAA